ncbi:MAG: type II toxin-antitoxin system HicA family toxin [Burkholderiales bacterium]|nr:type II toxin-antitoxin system HicA family toxin [Burkholderiales bacterium]
MLPVLTARKLLRALHRAGLVHHQTGSHVHLRHPARPHLRIVAPYHNRDLAPKTLRTIVAQAEMTVPEFSRCSMNNYEVANPILNSPYAEPGLHWYIREGEAAELREGRRASVVFPPRDQTQAWDISDGALRASQEYPAGFDLMLVAQIRERIAQWRASGYAGTTRTTLELLHWWQREGREHRLFFAQFEAAETVIFLTEARADFRQGIAIIRDDPGEDARARGFQGFLRYACKMATGSGKTTVMGMLAAWSILNKIASRNDTCFSDAVLVVCPNVTIRSRLGELDPQGGEASLYRTRDLVPPHLMPLLAQGRVLIKNWHDFEPRGMNVGGVGAKVSKTGVPLRIRETITIAERTTTARGRRYLTVDDLARQTAAGMLTVLDEEHDREGNLRKVMVESLRYIESDTALINRVLGRDIGGKRNLLVMNDEAHHAYRIKREKENDEGDLFEDDDDAEDFYREATVWIEGLDRIQKQRGINLCVDFSATPYYLGRVGQDANKPFPWVVSDFGLIDAIESGLVKIPQLAVRDTTGAAIPGYFNIWDWIMKQLTPAERGGRRSDVKPEAILKYAHTPIAMLGGLWEKELAESRVSADPRPPVFILVCKNTRIAKVIYEWLAEGKSPASIPPAQIAGFLNSDGAVNTIRVDSKVVHETDTGEAKSDEAVWMRITLDTIGRRAWPTDRQGRALYPEGFAELAEKLGRELHPPGRDVRCIVSVGMLTEGWDCNTVTHIIGLRPFRSQLLCEQVVGRGLRRASYELGEDGKFTEEIATVFGVPFEVIPFKATGQPAPAAVKRNHVHTVPQKAGFEIRFPRVEGYTQAIRNRITVDWMSVPPLTLDPNHIPPEAEMQGLHVNNQGRLSLSGPGRASKASLQEFRAQRRLQELVFDLGRTLTRDYLGRGQCEIPTHQLFPQVTSIVQRYLAEKVRVLRPADIKDVFLAPYYGWLVERLLEAIRPDRSQGEPPEIPRYERNRGPGSTSEVDFWTSRDVREIRKSHLNYVVADTKRWEQSAAYILDQHEGVAAFAKNAGLGFAIPYTHNGEPHDYLPDFIVKLRGDGEGFLILETKGYDPLEDTKRAAAERWIAAVNAEGSYGDWRYAVAKSTSDVGAMLDRAAQA